MTVDGLRSEMRGRGLSALESDIVLTNVTGRPAAWLRANGETELGEKMVGLARGFAERRAAGEPLAYIVGSVGFYNHTFLVDSRVLIPRPETEHLVDEALEFIKDREDARVLDVGTGSGAIACSILTESKTAHVEALDVSADALLVAMANATRLGVELRLSFYLGDASTPVLRPFYDVIVANLPYVPTNDIGAAPDPVSYEPRIALDGGSDGLDQYRRFLKQAPRLLGLDGMLLMEAAPPTIGELVDMAHQAFPEAKVTIGNDYGDRARLVKVVTPA
jgi:release factor glutamine methyltransferase